MSRRNLLKFAAVGTCAASFSTILPVAIVQAQDASLGILVDYSGGLPSPEALREQGYAGAIRYVSDRRPGAEWMIAKPLLRSEATSLSAAGLNVVSCYQFGKGKTADWRGGYSAGILHATRGLEIHAAAGGPRERPIYAAIDDNPSWEDFDDLIAPYLRGWESVMGHAYTGIYANSKVIDWAIESGLASWFWLHNWGTPEGFVHPAAHLHQFEIDDSEVDGVSVDLNSILKADYGQWSRQL
ncbi:MAG: DUF1906 domain-containing protein [Mycobacteriaceae bacterium]